MNKPYENQQSWQTLAAQCMYLFPDLETIDPQTQDLITVGADLEPATLLYAYSQGYFPMHLHQDDENDEGQETKVIGWFSPKSRAIFPINSLRVTKSMKQSYNKYECRIDTCFKDVIEMCRNVPRPLGWIDDEFIRCYVQLHELGFAHSIEIFYEGELVGGLYGVGFSAFFAGESMFHIKRDASKVALMHLLKVAKAIGIMLIDAQWMTDHLASLGAVEISRAQYLELIRSSLSENQDMVTWPSAGKLVY